MSYKILYSFLTFFLLIFFVFIKIFFFGELQFQSNIIHNELINNFNISIFIYKFLIISKYFFISFLKYPTWIFIILSSLYLFFKTTYFYNKVYFFIFFLLNTLFIFAIYMHTPYELKWLVSTSLSRILFGVSGFYVILLIDLLNYILKKKV